MAGDGPPGTRWTAERVGEAVIEAFRLLPDLPVYAPRRGGISAALPRHDIGPLEILDLSEAFLGHAAPERRELLVWARAKARRRISKDRRLRLVRSVPGGTVSDYCRETGANRRTFDRWRIRAAERIAAHLNRVVDEALSSLELLRIAAPALAAQVDRLAELDQESPAAAPVESAPEAYGAWRARRRSSRSISSFST